MEACSRSNTAKQVPKKNKNKTKQNKQTKKKQPSIRTPTSIVPLPCVSDDGQEVVIPTETNIQGDNYAMTRAEVGIPGNIGNVMHMEAEIFRVTYVR